MLKIPEKVKRQINRFPIVYRVQSEKAIQIAVDDAINVTADSCVCAALLVLVEEFGWGTDEKKSTRIPKFVEAFQKTIDSYAVKYDDAMAEGLRARLHAVGVDYKRE